MDSAALPPDQRSSIEARHDAQESVSILAGPKGMPFHPPLASIALGAWVCALGFDVVSKVARDPGVYLRGAYWLVLVGIVTGLLAATTGLLDALSLPRGTPVWRTAMQHLVTTDAAVLVFAASFLIRRQIDVSEAPWYLVALSLLGVLCLVLGTWSGLRLSYGWGVRVRVEADQLPGYERDQIDDGPGAEAETEAETETEAEADPADEDGEREDPDGEDDGPS